MSLTFEEAKQELESARIDADHESFHSRFDKLIERRLDELDPEFMAAMRAYYKESGMSRWCA